MSSCPHRILLLPTFYYSSVQVPATFYYIHISHGCCYPITVPTALYCPIIPLSVLTSPQHVLNHVSPRLNRLDSLQWFGSEVCSELIGREDSFRTQRQTERHWDRETGRRGWKRHYSGRGVWGCVVGARQMLLHSSFFVSLFCQIFKFTWL